MKYSHFVQSIHSPGAWYRSLRRAKPRKGQVSAASSIFRRYVYAPTSSFHHEKLFHFSHWDRSIPTDACRIVRFFIDFLGHYETLTIILQYGYPRPTTQKIVRSIQTTFELQAFVDFRSTKKYRSATPAEERARPSTSEKKYRIKTTIQFRNCLRKRQVDTCSQLALRARNTINVLKAVTQYISV